MKLILSIIQTADETDTVQELHKRGFFVTKLSTTGGFLKARVTAYKSGHSINTTAAKQLRTLLK